VNHALSDLYRDVVLDHGKQPRNRRRLEGDVAVAEADNPLCGDTISVYVDVSDGVVRDAAFEGAGCLLSTASASVMTEAVRGRPVRDVADLCDAFAGLVTAGTPLPPALPHALTAFAGVRAFPSRVKCTLLPWHALRVALLR
jgi:nitrogen fixation NifU-like protein